MSPKSIQANGAIDATAKADKRIAHGTIAGGLLVAATIVTAVIHYRLVIGFLPSELAGVWLVFWSFGSYLAFFDLGIGPTLSREIAFLATKKNRFPDIADLAATSLRIYIGIASLLLAFAVLAGWIFLPSLKLQNISLTDALLAWGLFSAGACINLIGNLFFSVLSGEGQVATERLTRAFSMLVWLALSSYALVTGHGLTGLALAWLVNAVIGRTLALTVLKLRVPGLLNITCPSKLHRIRRRAHGPIVSFD